MPMTSLSHQWTRQLPISGPSELYLPGWPRAKGPCGNNLITHQMWDKVLVPMQVIILLAEGP